MSAKRGVWAVGGSAFELFGDFFGDGVAFAGFFDGAFCFKAVQDARQRFRVHAQSTL